MRCMSKGRFSNFEDRLERLIEGGFARLFRGPLQPREVAVQIARAIEDNTIVGGEGREAAPTYYEIHLSPEDHAALMAQTPDLPRQLARQVITYCLEAGLYLLSSPEIAMISDPETPGQSLRVEARHVVKKHQTTQIMEPVEPPKPPPPEMPADAQLIVDGERVVPLTREIFNIGRHPDNDLVLSDLRVSRHHLQLRLRHGRYVLYDTQSRGGVYVNGQRVNEHILLPGDLIRIGSVSLLYMEDESQHDSSGDTQLDMHPPDLSEGS